MLLIHGSVWSNRNTFENQRPQKSQSMDDHENHRKTCSSHQLSHERRSTNQLNLIYLCSLFVTKDETTVPTRRMSQLSWTCWCWAQILYHFQQVIQWMLTLYTWCLNDSSNRWLDTANRIDNPQENTWRDVFFANLVTDFGVPEIILRVALN